MKHGLGYLHDNPVAQAARRNPKNWPMELLVPTALPVPDDFDTDCGPVLDQGGLGACVAFSASGVKAYQEKLDQGGWEFTDASAFKAYDWLKNGYGTFPGDGIPNVEGSYPQAVWDLALKEGIPAADGKARKIAAYYQLMSDPSDPAWADTQVQVLLQYGPVTVATGWPINWWEPDPATGLLPFPGGGYRRAYVCPKGLLAQRPGRPAQRRQVPHRKVLAAPQLVGPLRQDGQVRTHGRVSAPLRGRLRLRGQLPGLRGLEDDRHRRRPNPRRRRDPSG